MKKIQKTKSGRGWLGEDWRQAVHVLFGACVMLSVVLAGKGFTVLALLALLCISVLAVTWGMCGLRNPLFDFLMERFERSVEFPGKGALLYMVGALFLLTFASSTGFALAGIGILAFGDGVSTMAGVRGRHRLWWNAKKSFEGLLAFVLAGAVVAVPVIGWGGAVYAVFLGFVETLPTGLDDNLSIPVAAVLLNVVVK